MWEYLRICITDTIYLTEFHYLYDIFCISLSEHGEDRIYLFLTDHGMYSGMIVT